MPKDQKIVMELSLEREARKSGADRYITTNLRKDNFSIYIPQAFSRVNGEPQKQLKLTLELA